jgi:hypothetical protein
VAQKIVIDIVAETQKLKQGIDEAGGQLNSLDGKLKGLAATAGAAASAFVLKQGVTFLKQGIEEAKEAKETMTAANTTFGEGSAVLQKITADAEKFGKEIAVDNDTILQLATSLGSRLPADAKALSAELVNLGFDVEAYTGGAINAEAMTGKLAKALADGEVKATDLQKIVPDLSDAVYEQAEAASKAGDNQKALSIILDAAQKKYGDAAEKNVTSTQKFETALANFKEELGTKVLPILEKGIDLLTRMLDWFDKLPTPVQNFGIALAALIGIGGPLIGFIANIKVALVELGLLPPASGAAATGLNLVKVALAGLGILAVITLIVLLVQNWDKVTEAVGKVWEMIKDVVPKAWAKVKEFKDKVVDFVGDIIQAYLSIPSKMLDIGKNIVMGLWNGIQSMIGWIKNKVGDFFGSLIPSWAKKALGISSPSKVFSKIGTNITDGLWRGLQTKQDTLRRDIQYYFGGLLPQWVRDALQIASPSKVMIKIGEYTIDGFYRGIAGKKPKKTLIPTVGFIKTAAEMIPTLNRPMRVATTGGIGASPVQVTINAAPGTDLYSLGRTVNNAINKYSRISTEYGVRQRL